MNLKEFYNYILFSLIPSSFFKQMLQLVSVFLQHLTICLRIHFLGNVAKKWYCNVKICEFTDLLKLLILRSWPMNYLQLDSYVLLLQNFSYLQSYSKCKAVRKYCPISHLCQVWTMKWFMFCNIFKLLWRR